MNLPFIDFMAKRKVAGSASIVLVLLCLGGLGVQGLNLGLDFTGGTLVEVAFPEPVDPEQVRSVLNSAGYENGTVQYLSLIHISEPTRR